MRKLLFTFWVSLTLFSACSSDNDAFLDSGLDNNIDVKKYTVNFDIKSAGFEVDKAPMRSTQSNVRKVFQYVIYNEDGSVYSDSVYEDDKVAPLFDSAGNIPLTLQLPEGSYNMAILFLPTYRTSPLGNSVNRIRPQNFDTDYYSQSNPASSRFYITDVYYQVIELNVSTNSNNNQNSIILEPMWSEVILNIKNIRKAKKPLGTEHIRLSYNPYKYGFSIKTKLATATSLSGIYNNQLGNYTSKVDVDSVTFSYYPTKSEDSSMGLSIEYLRTDNYSRWYTLASQDIKFKNTFENGNRYIIAGDLPNAENIGNNQITLTFQPLQEDHIVIPFE